MTVLIIGICIFFGMHLVPLLPLKASLQKALGANGYKGVFSLVSLIGLLTMIWGFVMTRSGPDAARTIYIPQDWSYRVTLVFVFVALICLVASAHKGYLKNWLKSPMSIGVALWAIGHLFANGALGEVLFFGSFLAYSVLNIFVDRVRGRSFDYKPKILHDGISVFAAVILLVVFVWLHPYFIGVSVM